MKNVRLGGGPCGGDKSGNKTPKLRLSEKPAAAQHEEIRSTATCLATIIPSSQECIAASMTVQLKPKELFQVRNFSFTYCYTRLV